MAVAQELGAALGGNGGSIPGPERVQYAHRLVEVARRLRVGREVARGERPSEEERAERKGGKDNENDAASLHADEDRA